MKKTHVKFEMQFSLQSGGTKSVHISELILFTSEYTSLGILWRCDEKLALPINWKFSGTGLTIFKSGEDDIVPTGDVQAQDSLKINQFVQTDSAHD